MYTDVVESDNRAITPRIFIVLFVLWAGWAVLHGGDLATGPMYRGPDTSWSNKDGYTEYELKFFNLTGHELEVTLQAELHSYGPEVRQFGRGGKLLGSKKIEVLMPAHEELLVEDRISHEKDPIADGNIILSVYHKEHRMSTNARIKRTLAQLRHSQWKLAHSDAKRMTPAVLAKRQN